MKIIENKTFDEERALYGSHGLLVRNTNFDGPADGESAFKECSDITTEHCFFTEPNFTGEEQTLGEFLKSDTPQESEVMKLC